MEVSGCSAVVESRASVAYAPRQRFWEKERKWFCFVYVYIYIRSAVWLACRGDRRRGRKRRRDIYIYIKSASAGWWCPLKRWLLFDSLIYRRHTDSLYIYSIIPRALITTYMYNTLVISLNHTINGIYHETLRKKRAQRSARARDTRCASRVYIVSINGRSEWIFARFTVARALSLSFSREHLIYLHSVLFPPSRLEFADVGYGRAFITE